MTPCHTHKGSVTHDGSSRPHDSMVHDRLSQGSPTHRESSKTLGVTISNNETAGAKADNRAMERDWARSAPDSQMEVWVREAGVGWGGLM